jgi:hypothetical protein
MKPSAPKATSITLSDRFLTERAAMFVASHSSWLVLIPYVALRALQLHFLAPNSDVRRYFEAASGWIQHGTPYRDFLLEYPPGALIWSALPRLLTDDFARYSQLFAAQMVLADLAILYLLARLPARLHGLTRQQGFGTGKTSSEAWRLHYDGTVCMLAYIGLTFLLMSLGFERFDSLMALSLLAFLYAATNPASLLWADAMLCIGIWIKLVPLLVVPAYLVYAFASWAPKGAPAGASRQNLGPALFRWIRQEGWRRLLGLSAISIALWGPFYALAGDGLWTFLRYHQVRGLQLESLFSSLLMLMHQLAPSGLSFTPAFGAAEMVHPNRQMIHSLASLSSLMTVGFAVGISLIYARRLLRAGSQPARQMLLATAVFAQVLLMMSFNKVLSPQYLLWLAPLCTLASLDDHDRRRHILLGVGVSTFLTTLLWTFYYRNMLTFDPMAIALLLGRNFLLIATLIYTVSEPAAREEGEAAAPPSSAWQGLRRLVTHSGWNGVALGLCALWIFVANLSETTANDIWIQMRSGADIWRSGSFPSTEVYSATVMNRHFIAHEWLTSLLFHGLVSAFGAAGLSFLAAGVALLVAVLVYCSQPKSERHTLPYLTLMLATMYLVSFRILVRPHIFTIVAQACLLLALERWRRRGNWRELLWLLPVQLIWINLHGAAFFGPAMLFMMSGLVGVMAYFPVLQRSSERRTFKMSDALGLGLVGLGMGLMCLINPYGTDLLRFSIDLLNNEYAKSRVWEWTTPFLDTNFSYYWLWLYMAALVLLWISVAVRLHTLPVIDLAWAVLVTFLSVRANRFVPDFAIFAFPVIHRSMQYIGTLALGNVFSKRQPWVAMGMGTLLLANAVTYGYAHSAGEHRPLLGWGFGGDMPYQEVDLIKKMNLRGVIFNEYSDGSLIIHSLVPQVRPVLDSRIDLYPLQLVDEYDQAYVSPSHFQQYVRRHRVNLVMLIAQRANPNVLRYLAQEPSWQLLSQTNGRVLYRRRDGALPVAGRAAMQPPVGGPSSGY